MIVVGAVVARDCLVDGAVVALIVLVVYPRSGDCCCYADLIDCTLLGVGNGF